MSKFEVGDIVERVAGKWAGMKRGDRGRVQSIPHSHGVALEGWLGTHDVENLALVVSDRPSAPIGAPDDSYTTPSRQDGEWAWRRIQDIRATMAGRHETGFIDVVDDILAKGMYE